MSLEYFKVFHLFPKIVGLWLDLDWILIKSEIVFLTLTQIFTSNINRQIRMKTKEMLWNDLFKIKKWFIKDSESSSWQEHGVSNLFNFLLTLLVVVALLVESLGLHHLRPCSFDQGVQIFFSVYERISWDRVQDLKVYKSS